MLPFRTLGAHGSHSRSEVHVAVQKMARHVIIDLPEAGCSCTALARLIPDSYQLSNLVETFQMCC